MSYSPQTAQLGIGSPYDAIIVDAANRYVIDPALIKAVITKESSWNPNAYRAEPQIGDGSRGLMQILLGTARGMAPGVTAEQLFDPATNIDLGARYLANQLAIYGYPAGVSAYNAGHPITGNQSYVNDVDAYYSFFITNDPIFAPSGGGATYFPRLAGGEWRGRRIELARRRA